MTNESLPTEDAAGPPEEGPAASSVSPPDPAPPDPKDGIPPDLLWIKEGENRVLCTIYVYKDASTNRLRSLSLTTQDLLRELGLVEYPIESEWTIPTRDQLETYRERSTRPDPSRRMVVHRPTIQLFLLRHHLIEIRFPGPGGEMVPLDLPRDKSGSLSMDAFKILGRLHPSVLDLLLDKFVDEAALIL